MKPLINCFRRLKSLITFGTGRPCSSMLIIFILHLTTFYGFAQDDQLPLSKSSYPVEELQADFQEFRRILEEDHCCLYEYISKKEMDSLFDAHYDLIDSAMSPEAFFGLLAPITAKIGCMHTATWMPGRFFNTGMEHMFPLKIKMIGPYTVVTGSYNDTMEIPFGSIILDINDRPIDMVVEELRNITGADALNPWFIDAQLTHRFSMFYASLFGFPEEYKVRYAPPGRKTFRDVTLTPAHIDDVRSVVFSHFRHPPLEMDIIDSMDCAVIRIPTFIYYDRVDYFRNFMDSCFQLIDNRKIDNLVVDLRGNGGGDPFCAVILFSYLEPEPLPYFAEPYGKYADLAKPIPRAGHPFNGNLYTLVDGSCGSTNGHFCALLDYHGIGKFAGTPSGSTYKCNAGRNTEFQLENTGLILTIGRSTYSVAVEDMDKHQPIMPDILVNENYKLFLEGRDQYMDAVAAHLEMNGLY